jgi:hypothetical protein
MSNGVILAAFADRIHRGRRDKCGCAFALEIAFPDSASFGPLPLVLISARASQRA